MKNGTTPAEHRQHGLHPVAKRNNTRARTEFITGIRIDLVPACCRIKRRGDSGSGMKEKRNDV
jgi:hypothetical protein